MIFQRERIPDVRREAEPLLELHYREIAWRQDKIPLDVDWDTYFKLDAADHVICFTGRIGGELVAYSVYLIAANPHYKSTIFAKNDILFVHPQHRGKGGALIKYCDAQLQALGCHVVSLHVKRIFDFGPMIKRIGYDDVESVYLKWLGD